MGEKLMFDLQLNAAGQQFMQQLDELCRLSVRVGFQAGDTEEDGTPLTNIAYWNEHGTMNKDGSVHSPARPFMHDSVQNNMEKISDMCASAAKQVGTGKGSAQQALEGIGVKMVSLVQKEIRNGDFAANAPSTIRAKGSSKPLIDSGRMCQSVTFVIKEADKE